MSNDKTGFVDQAKGEVKEKAKDVADDVKDRLNK